MVRHLMAVCVVCLLCADHLPCKLHSENEIFSNGKALTSRKIISEEKNDEILPISSSSTTSIPPLANTNIIKTVEDGRVHENLLQHTSSKTPLKRHASYDHYISNNFHQEVRPILTKAYLEKTFEEYGQNDKHTLDHFEFQSLLKRLGLIQFLQDQQTTLDETIAENQTCYTDYDLVSHLKISSSGRNDQQHQHNHHHNHNKQYPHNHSDSNQNENITQASLKYIEDLNQHNNNTYNQSRHNYFINKKDFMNLCPILLYHVGANLQPINENVSKDYTPTCVTRETLQKFTSSFDSTSSNIYENDMFYVWVYAFLAVLACSILGLVGVAILPLMETRFYKSILQFLVSLAVGTMTGDALLHLLPHSLAGHNENNMVLKGLACLGGIMFFYVTEHGLTMISEWRKKKEKSETAKPSRARVMRDPDSSLNSSVTGEKVCKSKYSSYPYCYDEIAMDTMEDVWLHLPNKTSENNMAIVGGNNKKENETNETTAAQSLLCTPAQNSNNYSAVVETDKQCYSNNQQHIYNHNQQQCRNNRNKNIRPRHSQQQHLMQANQQRLQHVSDNNVVQTTSDIDCNLVGDGIHHNSQNLSVNTNGRDFSLMNNTVTVILREHESSHHGHSHKHGHVHSPPGSLSAVVWMIIMGDGLHNFTDGMAIGAAFAENLTGGFSTALAVFCHELPHELGDFAILLKAGMSVKTAVYYNLLTGVLSFIGMIFGIIFGQSHDTAQWMFAIAAGLFIYIAMVDMMPEITAAHKSLEEFAMQILGMTTGVLTMFLIAIYEDELINIFSSSGTNVGHHHSSNSITHHNNH